MGGERLLFILLSEESPPGTETTAFYLKEYRFARIKNMSDIFYSYIALGRYSTCTCRFHKTVCVTEPGPLFFGVGVSEGNSFGGAFAGRQNVINPKFSALSSLQLRLSNKQHLNTLIHTCYLTNNIPSMSSSRDAEKEIDGQAAKAKAAAEELARYYVTEQATDYVFDLDGEDLDDYCQELVYSGHILEAALSGCTRLEEKIPPSIFEGLRYRQGLLVGNVHNLPRFGAGRDISAISSASDQEKNDYERGVKAWAVFIWVFFGIW